MIFLKWYLIIFLTIIAVCIFIEYRKTKKLDKLEAFIAIVPIIIYLLMR